MSLPVLSKGTLRAVARQLKVQPTAITRALAAALHQNGNGATLQTGTQGSPDRGLRASGVLRERDECPVATGDRQQDSHHGATRRFGAPS